jgi:hypothetical protein
MYIELNERWHVYCGSDPVPHSRWPWAEYQRIGATRKRRVLGWCAVWTGPHEHRMSHSDSTDDYCEGAVE